MALLKRVLPVLGLMMLASPAGAQEPAAGSKPSSPSLNADTFRLPSSAYDTTRPSYVAPQPDIQAVKPGQFDLGDSMLQFDAKRNEPTNRVGIEAIDPKRLGGIRKDESTPLNYFGMTLSKPLN
jgi:hypothetical protein